ncbi:hypothetical protein NG99_21335 [Erwinia typographi]|uniref:Uncharacterized protein n=1 Tax=Erwinia typographi TaxID=371042 RepID=A0A0A3YNT6_9GAMM|nr:hypothetical protein [Erwinia typographi]KGT88305.1 hypothetical protein NG99_21335 [Erwinia typographi]
MKKILLPLILSVVCTGVAQAGEQSVSFMPKICPENSIVSGVYTALKSGLPEVDYRKKEDEKIAKLRDRIWGYLNEFDSDNKKIKFTVSRLSSQILSEKESLKYFEKNEIEGRSIYKEYYKVKNNQGAVAIYETFNVFPEDDLFRCDSIGNVDIVSYEG